MMKYGRPWLWLALSAVCCHSAWSSDVEGKFPGKGDISAWQKATAPFSEGVALYRAHSYEKAVEKYKAAIAIYSYDSHYFTSLGLAYKSLNNLSAAEEAFNESIKLEPAVWDSWSDLGSVLKRQGRTAQAVDAYNKALQFNPPAKTRVLLKQNIAALTQQLNALPAGAK